MFRPLYSGRISRMAFSCVLFAMEVIIAFEGLVLKKASGNPRRASPLRCPSKKGKGYLMSNYTMAHSLLLFAMMSAPADSSHAQREDTRNLPTYEEYLRNSVVDRQVLDTFLDPEQAAWAQFDPELGYILGNSMPRDGMDGARTISTVQSNGARTALVYTDRPCRINTYGNSFTQCHQVSDGETWQEYLAAHFGEPIRNFGMGGYGTYQAYRRMLREERTSAGAEYVVLYLWGDDHLRSVMRCRHAVIYPVWDHQGGRMFHNNFWANIELDLDSGAWVEKESRLPDPESLYKMCVPDFMVEALQDDLMVQLFAATQGWAALNEHEYARIERLAALLGEAPPDYSTTETCQAALKRIMDAYGYAATRQVLLRARDFCRQEHKKLLVITFCPNTTFRLLHGQERTDQALIAFLEAERFLYVDINLAHKRDFADFNLTPEAYMGRYCIGHYSPKGNHFFAFQIKDVLVDWLDPKPVTYRDSAWDTPDFQGYLPDTPLKRP